jgi:hypothetical protein
MGSRFSYPVGIEDDFSQESHHDPTQPTENEEKELDFIQRVHKILYPYHSTIL